VIQTKKFAYFNKINKAWIFIHIENVFKTLRSRLSCLTFTTLLNYRHVLIIKKLCFALTNCQEIAWRYTKRFHHKWKLIGLILTRENWETHSELYHYASKRPHINSWCVWYTKYDLWCPIKSRLDISVHTFTLETTWTEVNNFNTRFWRVFQ
jgi:hypothetical protein